VASQPKIGSRNFNRLSQSVQTRGPVTLFQHIFVGRNEIVVACAAVAVNHRAAVLAAYIHAAGAAIS
jgi:hypothetical protein